MTKKLVADSCFNAMMGMSQSHQNHRQNVGG